MARARRGSSGPTVGPEQIVQRAINQTDPGLQEHRLRKIRFDSAYDVWRGELAGEGNRQNPLQRSAGGSLQTGRDGSASRMRVKYAMQVMDQALANIVQGVPHAKATARVPGADAQAEAVAKLLNYYADLDHLAEAEPVIAQQAMLYGVSPAKVHWLYCEYNGRVSDDRPTLEPWDAYSIWWDPNAPTVDACQYIVLESWKTKEQLEAGRFNEQDGTGQWKNLDLLYESGDGPPPPSTAQNRILTKPPGANKGRFQLWEVWRRTPDGLRMTVIGNQQILLRDGPSPYRMDKYPITISNSRPDLFRIEGISEADMIDHLQQAMWTLENLRMENLKTTVMRPLSIRATVPDPDSIVLAPRARWLVNDHDDVLGMSFPPLPPEAYEEDQTILAKMQLMTGINAYVSGATGTTSGVDQSTATGVSLLTQSASRLLIYKQKQIQEKTWQRTFELWTDLCKQFVKEPVWVQVKQPGDTSNWELVGPTELLPDFQIRVEAGEDSALTAQEQASAIGLANALFPYVQLGVVDAKALVEKIGKAFKITDPSTLLAPPAPAAPMAAPNGNGAMNGGAPALLGTGLSGMQSLAPHPLASVTRGNQ